VGVLGHRAFDGGWRDGTKRTWKLLRSYAFHHRRHMNSMGLFESLVTEEPSGSMGLAKSTSEFLGILSLLGRTVGDSTNPDIREGFRWLGVEVDGGRASSKESRRKKSWCGRARRGHSATYLRVRNKQRSPPQEVWLDVPLGSLWASLVICGRSRWERLTGYSGMGTELATHPALEIDSRHCFPTKPVGYLLVPH
jgi:hypothetical protein